MFNPLKIFKNTEIGLALGSGGAKGIAHISVIEFLESNEIPINMIAGSSVGALVGAVYCAGNIRHFKEELIKMRKNDMLSMIDPVFPKSGLIEGKKVMDFIGRFIPEDARIEDMDIPLAIVAADYYSGMPIVFQSGNVLEAVRASISIPGVFVPVKYNDKLLIDGGVVKPLPIDVVREMGAGITIAVNLHPAVPGRRLKKVVKKMSGFNTEDDNVSSLQIAENEGNIEHDFLIDGKRDRKWYQSIEKWLTSGGNKKHEPEEKLPNIFEIISQSIDIMEYINTMLILKYNRPTVLIQPDLLDIMSLDFSNASKVLNKGYSACEEKRKSIMRRVKFWV